MAGTFMYFGGKSINPEESVVNETAVKEPIKNLEETEIVVSDVGIKNRADEEPMGAGVCTREGSPVKTDIKIIDQVVEKLNELSEQKATDEEKSSGHGNDVKPKYESSSRDTPKLESKITSIFDNPRCPDFIPNAPDVPYFIQNLGDYQLDNSIIEDEGFIESKNSPSLTVIFDEELLEDEKSSKPFETEDSFENSTERSLDFHSDLEARPSLTDVRSREYDQTKSDKKDNKITYKEYKESNDETTKNDHKVSTKISNENSAKTKDTVQHSNTKQNNDEHKGKIESTSESKLTGQLSPIQPNIDENEATTEHTDFTKIQTCTDEIKMVNRDDTLINSLVEGTTDDVFGRITDVVITDVANSEITSNKPTFNVSDDKATANITDCRENGTISDRTDSGMKTSENTTDNNIMYYFKDIQDANNEININSLDRTSENKRFDLSALRIKSDLPRTTEEVQQKFPEILENIRILMPSEVLVKKIEADQIVPQMEQNSKQQNEKDKNRFMKSFVPNIINIVPKTFDSDSRPIPCVINITPFVSNVEQVPCPMRYSQNRLDQIEYTSGKQTVFENSQRESINEYIEIPDVQEPPFNPYTNLNRADTEEYITDDILPIVFKSISKRESRRESNDVSNDIKSIKRPQTPYPKNTPKENLVRDAIEAIESINKENVSFNLNSTDFTDSTESGESIKSPPRPPPRLRKDTKKVRMNFIKRLFGIKSKK